MKSNDPKPQKGLGLLALQLLALGALTALTIALSLWKHHYEKGDDFFKDIMANVHAMLIEFFVLGTVVLSLRNRVKAKLDAESSIRHCREDIDDYRNWQDDTAARKILGSVRRLNKSGEGQIDLSYCYLARVSLADADLHGSDLSHATLTYTDLRGANLSDANLRGARLDHSNLQNANLARARFDNANLFQADLRGADLRGADLKKVADHRLVMTEGAIIDDQTLLPGTLDVTGLRRDPAALKRRRLVSK